MSDKKKKTVSIDAVLKAISNLEELENAEQDHTAVLEGNQDMQPVTVLVDPTMELANLAAPAIEVSGVFPGIGDERNTQTPKPKSLKERVAEKGVSIELSLDNKTAKMKGLMSFSNVGKRSMEDYKPTMEEMDVINKDHSNIDLDRDHVLTFTLRSADMALDRSYEHFTEPALQKMAQLSVGKAFLMDHDWNTASHIGKIYAASVDNGQLMQKVYMLNNDYNKKVIDNILAGIHNKVSVGFGVDLNEMICDSCGMKSIYDESCPHVAGNSDEKGASTAITIKDVNDYYEVSLVPVPAQKDAGIYRTLAKSLKDIKLPETIENPEQMLKDINDVLKGGIRSGDVASLRDAEYQEAIPNDTLENHEEIKNSDTINNDKSILGDAVVSDQKENTEVKMPDKESGVPGLDEKKPSMEYPANPADHASTEPGVPELNEKDKPCMGDEPDEKGKPKMSDDDEDDKSKSAFKKLKKSIKKLSKAAKRQAQAAKDMADATEARAKQLESQVKEQGERLNLLCQVVEAAATTTVDPLKTMQVSSTKANNGNWFDTINKNLSGGQ